uniref:Peptidase M13 N-terminal domain-containing protein n=1 Tax=Panagrolaimus sp. JU765 TaxID=591449 RepID=A0AC34QI83_9BILA
MAGPSGRAKLAEAESLGDLEDVAESTVETAEAAVAQEAAKKSVTLESGEPQTAPQRPQRRKPNKWPIILGVLLALAILAAIGIFIAWVVTSDGFRNLGGLSDVCSTTECIELAAGLTRSIDPSINICDNFYRYSCGQFHFQHSVQLNNFIDYQSVFYDELENGLNEILSKSADAGSFSLQFSKGLYSQCIDFPLRESVGTQPLIDLLKNLPCGPILPGCHGFSEGHFSLERNIGTIDFYAGLFNLIIFNRAANPQNPAEIILSFQAPDLTKFLEDARRSVDYLKPKTTSEFQALLSVQLKTWLINTTMTDLLGIQSSNKLAKDLDEIVEFIVSIDEISSLSRQNSLTAQIMPLQEFAGVLRPLDLQAVLDASLSASHTWSWTDTVAIYNLYYYQNLFQIIEKTSKKTLANYLTLSTAMNLKQYLHLKGDNEDWRNCLKQMSILDPVANVYASNKFQNFERLTSFFADLRAFFVAENLQFNPGTLDTLRRAEIKVGVPTRILDDTEMAQTFNSIRIVEDSYEQRKTVNLIPWQSTDDSDYFTKLLEAIKLQRASELRKIGTFVQAGDSVNWPSLEPRFIYNSLGNEFVIPLALLQNPPLALPLSPSPISSVLATTGFLFFAHLYEIANSLQQNNLDLSCPRQVYDTFVQPDLAIRTEDFVSRSVTYLNALELVFRKHEEWRRTNGIGREQALPGFKNYSDEQLIFLQFGSLMCSTEADALGSPYEAMMNTVASLSSEFLKLFKCPVTSKMNSGISCQFEKLSTPTFPPQIP